MRAAKNDNRVGYMVVAGHRDTRTPVYIDWAAKDGRSVTRLMKRLSKQSPGIATLEFCAGTIEDVRCTKRSLSNSWAGHGEWFLRTLEIDDLCAAIRDLYDEDDQAKAVQPAKQPDAALAAQRPRRAPGRRGSRSGAQTPPRRDRRADVVRS